MIFALPYVLIGAAIGSFYYYLQLKRDKRCDDPFNAIWIGALWPAVAPFAFGFYFARMMSERGEEK